jgi:redox-sensitive bicupin YhaK (pirin superfamily)
MSYCDGDVQWMRAGRGVIHEEMWDLREADWKHKKIEIFQLWVNLPAKSKSKSPSLHVLKSDAIPVIDCGNGVSVKVICGSLLDASLSVPSKQKNRQGKARRHLKMRLRQTVLGPRSASLPSASCTYR